MHKLYINFYEEKWGDGNVNGSVRARRVQS